ncbi:MAG: hypothetical protein AAB267_03700, partial [Candidatus Desantisbacteria bacterium]
GGMMCPMMQNRMGAGYMPMMERGMMGRWGNWDMSVPEKLSKPKNEEWVKNLQEVLDMENLSQEQYQVDMDKYQAGMPYIMVIPQEQDHIDWISNLFTAYDIKPDTKVFEIKQSELLIQAYDIAKQLEASLIPLYSWLIKNAEDRYSQSVLQTILSQTRRHYMMFSRASGTLGNTPGISGMGMGMCW